MSINVVQNVTINGEKKGRRSTYNERLRAEWDSLQGALYEVEYQQAQLLHGAYRHHNCNTTTEGGLEPLETLLVRTLGIMRGKRAKRYVRMAIAFGVNDTFELWRALGGSAMILLTRVDGRSRPRIIHLVEETLERTGEVTISSTQFRLLLRENLSSEAYSRVCLEHQSAPNHRSTAAKLRKLTSFLLGLAEDMPKVKKAVMKDKQVREILYPEGFR